MGEREREWGKEEERVPSFVAVLIIYLVVRVESNTLSCALAKSHRGLTLAPSFPGFILRSLLVVVYGECV